MLQCLLQRHDKRFHPRGEELVTGFVEVEQCLVAVAGCERARGERGAAAVLSPRAAALFGLEVLADGIQGDPDNRTRFLVVAPTDALLPAARPAAVDPSGAARTTLVMGIRNEPGALLRAMTVFADHDLNMSKLESRPARDRPWEYVFWVDLDADAAALAVTDMRGGPLDMPRSFRADRAVGWNRPDVKVSRAKAAKAGNLKSDDKQLIVEENNVIQIVPANPQVRIRSSRR